MFSTVLVALLATLCTSTAEVICNPSVPISLVPSLQSCDYAIRRLHVVQQSCGMSPMIFSPTATPDPRILSLPAMFVGAGPDYTPVSPVWCAIMILWQPRPTARPAVEGRDVFPFSKVLKAANGIEDRCLRDRAGSRRMIGREWMEPNEWVDVQFGGVFGPKVLGGLGLRNFGGGNDSGDGAGNRLRVMMADGTNMSVVPSALNEVRGCGGLLSFGNGTARTIE